MTSKYYHFYEIPKAPKTKARRRNIAPARSAAEARRVRDYYNSMKLPTAVFINQQSTSPDDLPDGERLWR